MLFRILKRRLIRLLTNFYDPLVSVRIGNEKIKLNLSHQLPEILLLFPNYNFNLARIVKYTEEKVGNSTIIDIGANVGDTVAFIRNYSDAPILCIDGEEHFVKLLKENTKQYTNVKICKTLVGSENKVDNIKLSSHKGTASIEASTDSVSVRTLSNILDEFPQFHNSKMLKTDTDGFDTIILRSCEDYLKKVKPILFFEFDPHFIKVQKDDPFQFMEYLRSCGYHYLIFYTNVGDFLLSCSFEEQPIINQIIHYYSGRNVEMFVDVCAFVKNDKDIFEYIVEQEMRFYQSARNY